MDVLAVAHDGEEERAAGGAACVVEVGLAVDQQPVGAFRDLELLPLDPRERLERRAGGARQREQWQFIA